MATVADILAAKGRTVHTIDRKATALDAVSKMVEANVGSLIVTEDDAIYGIFTERDYLRRIVLADRPPQTRLTELSSRRLVVVEPSRSVEDCMSIMTAERVRHLPVIDRSGLTGIVSIGDLVKHLSREQAAEIRYLTDYISGKYPG